MEKTLPAGEFGPLSFSGEDSVTVTGAGPGRTVLRGHGSKPAFYASGCGPVRLEGVTCRDAGNRGVRALRVIECKSFTGRNLEVKEAGLDLIHLASVPRYLIEDAAIDGAGGLMDTRPGIWGHAVYIAADTADVVEGLMRRVVARNTQAGALQANADGARVRSVRYEDCEVYDCGRQGGAAWNLPGVDSAALVNCLAAWPGGTLPTSGVASEGGRNITVDRSTLWGPGRAALNGPILATNCILAASVILASGASLGRGNKVGTTSTLAGAIGSDYSSLTEGVGWHKAGVPITPPPVVDDSTEAQLRAANEEIARLKGLLAQIEGLAAGR